MSIWSRLFARSRPSEGAWPPVDSLVEEPRQSATRLGAIPQITPWSTSRLSTILQTFQSNPSLHFSQEARLARQCLSQFWLQAPVDQLESFYSSGVGECFRQLLASGLAQLDLTREEQVWKNTLADRLAQAFSRPETTNVLLALMPYYAPGKMRVADPMTQIPGWLLQDYARLFDPELLQRIWQPAGLLAPAGQAYGPAPRLGLANPVAAAPAAPAAAAPMPANPLPRLSRQRGAEALAAVQEGDFQRRMSGLINLFVIDPTDANVIQNLIELRRLLGQIWLDAQPSQLQALYSSAGFGRLYRELLASGFSRLNLIDQDRFLRNQLAMLVADMSQPGAINALMAVLPFYPPGKIAFGGGEQHMPEWLVQEIGTIYGQVQPAEAAAATAQP
jgi:hypothetical protein